MKQKEVKVVSDQLELTSLPSNNSSLSKEQLERYSRNILLKEIGKDGQLKLLSANVVIIGAGALGSPISLYLAAAGVGNITIIDNDLVELSNLQRQIMYNINDIDSRKVEACKRNLLLLNPDINVEILNRRLTKDNYEEICPLFITKCDVIIDGSDNFRTRFLINEIAHSYKKPLISAAIRKFNAQIATFKSYQHNMPCYLCFNPNDGDISSNNENACYNEGVIGAVAGIAGSLAANEAIKEIIGYGKSLAGYILIIDLLDNNFRKVKLSKDVKCKLCSSSDSSDI